jgi:uncharacterized protein YjiS (DUF1127 family)
MENAMREFPQRSVITAVSATLGAWFERWEQRRILENLTDAALADIGLRRADARLEARRPFWDGRMVAQPRMMALSATESTRRSRPSGNSTRRRPVADTGIRQRP